MGLELSLRGTYVVLYELLTLDDSLYFQLCVPLAGLPVLGFLIGLDL